MDIAIRNWASDRLGRRGFAESLAAQIWAMSEMSEGYVIGLEAEWGAGKSSVVNMTIHRLLHLDMHDCSKRPAFHGDTAGEETVSDLDDLATHFESIAELNGQPVDVAYMHPDHYHRAIAARAGGDPALRTRIYRYFRLRMNAYSSPQNLVVHFRPWLVPDTASLSSVFLEELTKSIGALLGREVEDAMKSYTAIIKRLAPVAGVAAQAILPGSGNAIRDFLSSLGAQSEATLESRKVRLEVSLRKLRKQKVVVVIDDLDRLNPKEATEMVGLVKSLGNLPNIVYLMSYDPAVLCRHLERTLQLDAEAYMEKIVQYRRSLPLLPRERLLALLDDARGEMFDEASSELIDRVRDANFYVLRQYICTPRDAVRCGDWALRAHRLLKNQTDPVDLLILEVLNAKDRALYDWIRYHLDELCRGAMFDDDTIEQSLERNGIPVSEQRKSALAQLFPLAAREFIRSGNNSSNDRRDKRLRVREHADTYFALTEPVTSSGKAELERLFASEDPKLVLTEIIARSRGAAYGSSVRAELLDTIWEHFNRVAITRAWIIALVDFSVELIVASDREPEDVFAPDNLRRLTGAVLSGLEHLPANEQVALIELLLARSADLSLVASVLRRLDRSGGRGDNEALDLSDIKRSVAERLQREIADDALLQSAYPAHLVFLAAELLGHSVVKEHLDESLRNGNHLTAIARTILNEGSSSEHGHFYSLMSEYERFVDEELLSQAATLEVVGRRTNVEWAKRIIAALERRADGSD